MLKKLISLLLVGGLLPLSGVQSALAESADKNDCLTLLTAKAIPFQKFDSSRMATARIWLRQITQNNLTMLDRLMGNDEFAKIVYDQQLNWFALGKEGKIDLAARYLLNLWENWKNTSERQRDASLSLEIMKLSPQGEPAPHQWNGDVALSRLSQENLKRLLAELNERYPLSPWVFQKPELIAVAQRLAQDLHLQYLRQYEEALPTGYYPAIASERELNRHRLFVQPSFFSKLLDESATVGFSVMASKMDESLFFFNGKFAMSSIRLDPSFAEDHGFMMPMFTSLENIFSFMKAWEPDTAQTLIRQNKFSLPRDINGTEKFFQYLEAHGDKIFPEHNMYVKLAPFRQSLHKYILTVNDGRTFLHQAFVHFVLWKASEDPRRGAQNIALESAETAGLQNVFHRRFLDWLGWSGGIALRVPTVVTPNQFSILRIEPLRYGRSYGLPDRRVDKSGMP